MANKIASLDPTARPLPWALFFGWDSELIPDLPLLSKDVLNDFSPEIPICVIGQSGHVAWVNQKAFEVGFFFKCISGTQFKKMISFIT